MLRDILNQQDIYCAVSFIEQCSFLHIILCLKIFDNVTMDNNCISFPVSLSRFMQHFLVHVCWFSWSCVLIKLCHGNNLLQMSIKDLIIFIWKTKVETGGLIIMFSCFSFCDNFFKVSWLWVILCCYSILLQVTLHSFTKMLWMFCRGPRNFDILQGYLQQFWVFCCVGILRN